MLKHLYRGLVVGAVVVAGFGCSGGSGDDDDDSGATPSGIAAMKCTTFIDVYCTNVVNCLVDSGKITATARNANVDACKSSASQSLDCSRAADVTSSYDACLAAVSSPDCDAVNTAIDNNDAMGLVPEVCHGVILLYQ